MLAQDKAWQLYEKAAQDFEAGRLDQEPARQQTLKQLKQVLDINPNHVEARKLLTDLQKAHTPPVSPLTVRIDLDSPRVAPAQKIRTTARVTGGTTL